MQSGGGGERCRDRHFILYQDWLAIWIDSKLKPRPFVKIFDKFKEIIDKIEFDINGKIWIDSHLSSPLRIELDLCIPWSVRYTSPWPDLGSSSNTFWISIVWLAISLVQARSQGGGLGGRTTPPQLPIPKILFHPLAILFHPLAILFHLSAILFHPLAILFHPSAILFHPSAILFHPLAILFHPWNMDDVTRAMSKGRGCLWMSKSGGVFQIDDVTRAMSKGGGCLWMSKSGGVFQIDDVTRTMSKGGCAWCSTHPSIQVQTPPTWLAGYGPARHCMMFMIFDIHATPRLLRLEVLLPPPRLLCSLVTGGR